MIRIVFAVTVSLGIWHSAGVAVAASAKDCIAMEETDADDILTYRNDCNRTVIFYYCVIDPQKTEVVPCRRIITGNRRIAMQSAKGPAFLTLEMEPRTPYEVKLWAARESNGRLATPSLAVSNRSRRRATRDSIFHTTATSERLPKVTLVSGSGRQVQTDEALSVY